MAAYGSFVNVDPGVRVLTEDSVWEQSALTALRRICQENGVDPIRPPLVEWAKQPEMDWDDPETGETLHLPEMWIVRATVDAV